MKKTVALLFGGKGEEHAVSCRSAAAVFRHLDPKKYSVIPVGIDKNGDFYIYKGDGASIKDADFRKRTELLLPTFPLRLSSRRGLFCEGELISVDAVVAALHGRGGEDGEVQGLLSAAGIPFVGCDAIASALCFDKEYAKLLARAHGVDTADFVSVPEGTETAEAMRLAYAHFPEDARLFVKPARQGSSVGASYVECKSCFAKSYDLARTYGKVLVEEYIENKRELEVAMLEREGELLFSGAGEIRSGAPLYSYRQKYSTKDASVRTRASLPEQVREALLENCRTLATALSLSGLARLDFFYTDGGRLLFNEVNTLPGFTESSLFPRLWEDAGLSFTELLDILIGEAIARASR